MENIKSKNTKKTYKSPCLGNFMLIAAIPLVAPLAFISASSTAAFVGGLVGGAAATAALTHAAGNKSDMQKIDSLHPLE